MLNWINSHGIEVLIIYWVFSAAISNMPTPKTEGDGFYHWVYGFLHDVLQFTAGAINRIPQVRQYLGTEKK